jgi:hypothetical protein
MLFIFYHNKVEKVQSRCELEIKRRERERERRTSFFCWSVAPDLSAVEAIHGLPLRL